MLRTFFAAALAALTVASAAPAHDYHVGDLIIDHPWARATTTQARATGGFMTITNTGDQDDRLLSASSEQVPVMEIHITTEDENGVMRMREQEDGIVIPAGGSLELRPGSYHVMFMGLTAPFVEGEEYTATLVFERAGEIEVVFAVESFTGGMDHSGHGGMDHSTH